MEKNIISVYFHLALTHIILTDLYQISFLLRNKINSYKLTVL